MSYDTTAIIWLIFAFITGTLIGSFLNVCVYRLPAKETVVKGHSYCPSCRHILAPADLVPVLSYLLLGRRCRYCRTRISSRYAVVEIITGIYFLLTTLSFINGWTNAVLPAKLPSILANISPGSYTALSIASYLFLFCSLLVSALIIADGNVPPIYIYGYSLSAIIWIFLGSFPAIPQHLVYALAAGMAIFAAAATGLLPDISGRKKYVHAAGSCALALFFGFPAALVIILLYLVLPAAFKIFHQGNRHHLHQLSSLLPVISLILISLADFFRRMF